MLADNLPCGFSDLDAIVTTMGVCAYLTYVPVRHYFERRFIIPHPKPAATEMRTVTFLRSLDLDPEPILGHDIVEAADHERVDVHGN